VAQSSKSIQRGSEGHAHLKLPLLYLGRASVLWPLPRSPAGSEIVASDFSLCLTICRSFCGEPSFHSLTLRRKVAVNRCHACSNAEDKFFAALNIDIDGRAHFRICIVFVR
jgi:hypothetical protein